MMQVEHRRAHQARIQQLLNAGGGSRSREFARQVEQLVIEGNAIDRKRGIDRMGRPLQKWRWRVGKYDGATGPTLLPFGEASRAITTFFADTKHESTGWRMTAGFRGPGVEILAYHAAGKAGCGVPIYADEGAVRTYSQTATGSIRTRVQPSSLRRVVGFRGIKGCTTGIVRDIFGVSRNTRRDIQALFREHAQNTFRARVGRAAQATYRRAASFFGGIFG